MLPRDVHVERSIEVARPVNTVFTLLNRLTALPAWSPWLERDARMNYRFTGPEAGVGARLEWSGDPRRVGTGWAEITESQPRTLLRMQLVLEQQGRAETTMRVQRIAGGARVNWSLDTDLAAGKGPFAGLVSRYFGLIFDRWVGADLELGLERFKAYAESLPAADFSGLELEWLDVAAIEVLQITESVDLAAAYREITTFMAANGIERTGQPMTVTHYDADGDHRIDAAIPASRSEVRLAGRLEWATSPSGRAIRLVHVGSYDALALDYQRLAAYLEANGIAEGGVSWEHYISDPNETPEAERITHIYFLLGAAN
jgi:effector-binding domain-containing protein